MRSKIPPPRFTCFRYCPRNSGRSGAVGTQVPASGTKVPKSAVAARLQRQQFLYDPAKHFEFLLAEPVMGFLLVPPPMMRAQLDRLQTVIGLDHVRFGIIPMGRVLTRTPQASVQLYVGEETIAVTEDFAGETWHRENATARPTPGDQNQSVDL